MKKIAVLIWIYHNDLTKEFISVLDNTTDIFDIYVGLCDKNNNSKTIFYLHTLQNVKSIQFYPNVGADIYSFIDQISLLSDQEYDYFIKLHSKKSKWGIHRICNWRAMLIDSLIGDLDNVKRNANIMKKYNYGCLGCCPLMYKNTEGLHKDKIAEVAKFINFNPDVRIFVGGNMFMGDVKLYQKYIIPNKYNLEKFLHKESGKVNEKHDGNYSHAIERILGYIGCEKGIGCSITNNLKIKAPKNLDINSKFLSFRHMYNDDIYCVRQPNIYGRVSHITPNQLNIIWTKKQGNILAKYIKIAKNKYINQIHLDN